MSVLLLRGSGGTLAAGGDGGQRCECGEDGGDEKRGKVPTDMADDLLAFDGSMRIDEVGGELSARCDLESNNVLTLNLANDIVTGKKSVVEARKEFGQIVSARALGKKPAYAMALQFEPVSHEAAANRDHTTVPGAPQRPGSGQVATAPGKGGRDAELMAKLVALDQDEIRAASAAETEKVSPAVKQYAQMLHEDHGKNLQKTLELGQKIGVTPQETQAVEDLHAKDEMALAEVVPLDGEAFGRAYVAQMVQGHTDALRMVEEGIQAAQNDELKQHLTQTRDELQQHLDAAKKLQADNGR